MLWIILRETTFLMMEIFISIYNVLLLTISDNNNNNNNIYKKKYT